jgi:hypothetical protein
VRLKAKTSRLAQALDHAGKAGRSERRAALRRKHERRLWFLFAVQAPQGTQLIAADRVRGWRSRLHPSDSHRGRIEIDLIPAQVNKFAHPEPVAIGYQYQASGPPGFARAHDYLLLFDTFI